MDRKKVRTGSWETIPPVELPRSPAMNFLAHADAIIFDLRENGGGDPKMVASIATYPPSTGLRTSAISTTAEKTRPLNTE